MILQLDGRRQAEPVVAMAEQLGLPAVVVGVDHTQRRDAKLRLRDDSPSEDPRIPGSGGAPRFIDFLTEELFPQLQVDYAVDTASVTLMGRSAAGPAVVYAALTQPQGTPLSRFVAASPSLFYDDGVILDLEQARALDPVLAADITVAVGEMESVVMVGYATELTARMQQRAYQGLKPEFRIVADTPHEGTWRPTCRHALEELNAR